MIPRCARLLIAVREDFLSRPAEHRALIEKTDDNLILLRPPDADDLRAALCAPAALHSFTFEPGLADAVLNDFETDRHAAPLPIPQLVATKLWEGRDLTTRRLRQATLAQVEASLAYWPHTPRPRLVSCAAQASDALFQNSSCAGHIGRHRRAGARAHPGHISRRSFRC